MKTALIALVLGLFSVATVATATETAPVAKHSVKVAKNKKKHPKKGEETKTEEKKTEETKTTTEAPAAAAPAEQPK